MSQIILPNGPFGTILVDPPWRFSDANTRGAADDHYRTMSAREIMRMPVEDIAAENSHLFLWSTAAHLQSALEIMEAWGYSYKQNLVWVKAKDGRLQMGLGHYFRHAHELCLFGTKGRAPALDHSQKTVFWAERQEHSRKPDHLYSMIEQVSPGPYCELFARRPREGWTAWGNELEMTPTGTGSKLCGINSPTGTG